MSEHQAAPPIVDPSPTAAPIAVDAKSLDEMLKAHPAPASPPEVLELKPNRAVDATEGPHPQISQLTYVHMKAPDGRDFLCPLANVEHYEAKGFKKGASEDIEDIGAYWAEKATAKPAKAK